MDWIVAHIEVASAATGILSALWAATKWADRNFKKHLSEEFATKADLNTGLSRVESKVDKLIAFQVRDFNRDDKLKLM